MPIVGFKMPKNWVRIRNELHKLSHNRQYINRNEYISICSQFDVDDYEKQMELSSIFHDLGIFLHFQNYSSLEDFIILQNAWATDAVFFVLDNPKVISANGKFTDDDLSSIWHSHYETKVHKKLLSLMMQFELCYKIENVRSNIYIVPEMLSDRAPKGYSWHANKDIPLEYRYDFMPKGILTRLIVRLNKHISFYNGQQILWKTGVKIEGASLGYPQYRS